MIVLIDVILTNSKNKKKTIEKGNSLLFEGDCSHFLDLLPKEPVFDLIVTSPPYNIGKSYERRQNLKDYILQQKKIIKKLYPLLKENGSLCWQVGNYVHNGEIIPLDIEFANIFKELDMPLRNRIIWTFGHGLHSTKRFSGRYEVILWYTKSDSYTFNLDAVRIPSKYPGKRAYKGPNKGMLSGNKDGKNPSDVWQINLFDTYEDEKLERNPSFVLPSDVWEIPNVVGNHIEKTEHPCQYPVALVERLVKALTNPGDLVFDPFCGVASAGVAALSNGRRFWGCEMVREYIKRGEERLNRAETGTEPYRAHDIPVYNSEQSNLSKIPKEWRDEAGMKVNFYSHKSGDRVVPENVQEQIRCAVKKVSISTEKGKATEIRTAIIDELKSYGWSDEFHLDPTSNISITSIYEKIGLCVQFGNISRVYADLMKLQTLFLKESIHAGVIIMPNKKAARILGDNITNSDRVLRELDIFNSVITMPLLIVDFEE